MSRWPRCKGVTHSLPPEKEPPTTKGEEATGGLARLKPVPALGGLNTRQVRLHRKFGGRSVGFAEVTEECQGQGPAIKVKFMDAGEGLDTGSALGHLSIGRGRNTGTSTSSTW